MIHLVNFSLRYPITKFHLGQKYFQQNHLICVILPSLSCYNNSFLDKHLNLKHLWWTSLLFIHPPIPITTINCILYWNTTNNFVSLFLKKSKKISSVWYIKYLHILTYLKWWYVEGMCVCVGVWTWISPQEILY